MRFEPLYRIRFTYPESWMIGFGDGWEQHLFLAEGRCEGSITGRFRGANFPRRHGAAGPFRPDFRAVIETDDGATIMFEWHGYGRAYPPGRRQIVGAIFHLSDAEQYRRLNDAVCVCEGEVRAPGQSRSAEAIACSTLPTDLEAPAPTPALSEALDEPVCSSDIPAHSRSPRVHRLVDTPTRSA